MNFFLECALKTSAVFAAALVASFALRGKSAALRHGILSIAILVAAPIPFTGYVIPSWHFTVPLVRPAAIAMPSTESSAIEVSVNPVAPTPAPARLQDSLPFAVWMGGVTLSLIVVLVGALRLAWIAAASRPVIEKRWLDLSATISSEYRLRRSAKLLQSPNPTILITWGILRPKVVLPAGADQWSEDRAHVVLSHELAHVRRGDWLIHMVAELLRAVYWFNPLIWIIRRRLRIESEHACDDAALARGITGPDYAAQLLDLARDLNANGRTWSAALAMARPSTIERRFEAMLNPSLNRQPITATAMLCTLAVAFAVALPIGMFSASPAPQTATGGVAGTVLDSAGAAVRSATVIISTAAGQTEVTTTTNAGGRYGFTNLPAGVHVIQVFATGFGPSRITNIELKAGQLLVQDVRMDIGFVATQESTPEATRPKAVNNPVLQSSASQRSTATDVGQGTIKGTVTDASGAVIPGVEVSWVAAGGGSARRVVTDENGNFVLARVVTGPFRVTIRLPGFKTLNIDGVINADNEVVTLLPQLTVAPTAEEVTVVAQAGSSSEPPAIETPAQCAALPVAPPPPPVDSSIPGRIRQGGSVQQAMLLGQTKPVYPAAAKMEGTQGAVIMQIVVGRDGRVSDIRVISGAPVLADAAMDAVRRWCYTPTKLNGQPVEVVSTVSINFVLR
jgi:TonB family protein